MKSRIAICPPSHVDQILNFRDQRKRPELEQLQCAVWLQGDGLDLESHDLISELDYAELSPA